MDFFNRIVAAFLAFFAMISSFFGGGTAKNTFAKVIGNEDVKKIFNRKVQEKNGPDLGIPLSGELIEFWIAALPVALITQGQAHGLKRDDFGKALRIIQRFVEYGIDK